MIERQRTVDIRLAIPAADLALIDRAAHAVGRTRSSFIRETACREAHEVLCDQTAIKFDRKTFAVFIAELDRPPRDNPRLRALMQRRAPWE